MSSKSPFGKCRADFSPCRHTLSSANEARGTLLREGRESLTTVRGRDRTRVVPALGREAGLQRPGRKALVDGTLGGSKRDRPATRYRPSKTERLVFELFGGSHQVDDAIRQRLRGRRNLCGENPPLSPSGTDQSGETLGSSSPGNDSQRALRQSDSRLDRGDAQIASEGELEPPPKRCPRDHGHRWQLDRGKTIDQSCDALDSRKNLVIAHTAPFLEIRPGAKGAATRGEQNDPQAGIAFERGDRMRELVNHPAAERIDGRAIQRDPPGTLKGTVDLECLEGLRAHRYLHLASIGSRDDLGQDLRMATWYRLREGLPVVLLALVLSGTPTWAETAPQVVYDSEFQGYLPIVGGIERPDLAASRPEGRLPSVARKARRRARRRLRREASRPWQIPGPRSSPLRRLERRSVMTELLVYDSDEQPLLGARVYRYTDPSFYAVNEDEHGARLFAAYRYLPRSYPAARALADIRRLEEIWLDRPLEVTLPAFPVPDQWHNPWARENANDTNPPLEFVGTTDLHGRLHIVTPLFATRERKLFPQAIVPRTLRLGLVVVSDGYLAGLSEREYSRGGVREERTITLLPGRAHRVLAAPAFSVARRLFSRIDLSAQHRFEEIEAQIVRIAETLNTLALPYPEDERQRILDEARARLIARVQARAETPHRIPLARWILRLTPDSPVRKFRLARELAAIDRYDGHAGSAAPEETPSEREAASLLQDALRRDPDFLPAARLAEELLRRRGPETARRRALLQQLFERHPFDRYLRARLASLAFNAERPVEAFDHLRYTFSAIPGLGRDPTLARALADYSWRLGLPEKAGTFTWLLTGRVPEDPFVRIRGKHK